MDRSETTIATLAAGGAFRGWGTWFLRALARSFGPLRADLVFAGHGVLNPDACPRRPARFLRGGQLLESLGAGQEVPAP